MVAMYSARVLKRRREESFAYVLEYMLTFDKMQNTSPLMCIKFEI